MSLVYIIVWLMVWQNAMQRGHNRNWPRQCCPLSSSLCILWCWGVSAVPETSPLWWCPAISLEETVGEEKKGQGQLGQGQGQLTVAEVAYMADGQHSRVMDSDLAYNAQHKHLSQINMPLNTRLIKWVWLINTNLRHRYRCFIYPEGI